MFEQHLIKLLENSPTLATQISAAVELLSRSGALDLFKHKATPRIGNSKDPTQLMVEGVRAAGYADALYDLTHFRERYVNTPASRSTDLSKGNTIDLLVENGNLTKEEADALRSNTRPDYNAIAAARNANTGHRE